MDKQDEALREALDLLDRGDWQRAHAIVQGFETELACWLHGVVHVMEEDFENANYWFSRAKRTFSTDVPAELAAARAALESM